MNKDEKIEFMKKVIESYKKQFALQEHNYSVLKQDLIKEKEELESSKAYLNDLYSFLEVIKSE